MLIFYGLQVRSSSPGDPSTNQPQSNLIARSLGNFRLRGQFFDVLSIDLTNFGDGGSTHPIRSSDLENLALLLFFAA